MADMELVLIVKGGRDAVAKWREENPTTTMDLSEAYMSHTRLPQVDLTAHHQAPLLNYQRCRLNNFHYPEAVHYPFLRQTLTQEGHTAIPFRSSYHQ